MKICEWLNVHTFERGLHRETRACRSVYAKVHVHVYVHQKIYTYGCTFTFTFIYVHVRTLTQRLQRAPYVHAWAQELCNPPNAHAHWQFQHFNDNLSLSAGFIRIRSEKVARKNCAYRNCYFYVTFDTSCCVLPQWSHRIVFLYFFFFFFLLLLCMHSEREA